MAAAFAPRVVLFFMWIIGPRVNAAFDTFIVPLLGLIFLPYTTIMYVLVWSPATGVAGWDWVWVLLGVALDVMKWGQIANKRKEIPGYPSEYEPTPRTAYEAEPHEPPQLEKCVAPGVNSGSVDMRRGGARRGGRRTARRTTRRRTQRTRRRRRRRRRRMLLVGGMVLLGVGAAAAYGAVKISQKDKDRIEEHTGESVEEMSEEELVQAMKDLGIESIELSEEDKAALAAQQDTAEVDGATVTYQGQPGAAPAAVTTAAAATTAAAPSYLDELERLAGLRDQGVITEEEFAAKKGQLLGL
jgi:hypothetical protein